MRLRGTFDHAMDDKSRVTLPSDYRAHFSQGAVLVRLPVEPNCVCVFSDEDWDKVESRFIEVQNDFSDREVNWSNRLIYKYMAHVVPDRQGRILVQPSVSKGLDLSGKVAILGIRDHLEIWNPSTLEQEEERRQPHMMQKVTAKEAGDES